MLSDTRGNPMITSSAGLLTKEARREKIQENVLLRVFNSFYFDKTSIQLRAKSIPFRSKGKVHVL